MPREKDLKRIVRSRMQKTGESYTAARRQIVGSKPEPKYAELAGMSDFALEKQTGHPWREWVAILDAAGAAKMEHPAIARFVSAQGVGSWWSQTVTVGYERIRGLRARGQRRSGTWEVNKSRTFAVPVATLFDAFSSAAKRKRWLGDATLTVRKATRPKSMRMTWEDGTSVDVGFLAKGPSKSSVAVQHAKLASKEDAARMKAYWSERLDALGRVLAR